jgi:hypothetical protein
MEFESNWLNDLPATYFDEWDSPMRQEWEATRYESLELDERLPLSWYWTLRLAEAFQVGGLGDGRPLPPGFLWSSVGLIHESESSRGRFGVILFVDSRVEVSIAYQNLAPFSVGGEEFPIAVRPVALEDHRSIAAPRAGSVSLGKTRSGTKYECFGWLTAAHVVEGANDAVYEDATLGTILDLGPGCIDVALVEDSALSMASKVIPIKKAVTMGLPGSFTGTSGTYSVTVTNVSTSLGVLDASALPVRVGLSDHGVAGDSGARVEAADGSVIGLYLGKYRDKGGNDAGLAQMADQMRVLMGVRFMSLLLLFHQSSGLAAWMLSTYVHHRVACGRERANGRRRRELFLGGSGYTGHERTITAAA